MNLALDVGATNIRIALIDKTKIIDKIKTPTPLIKKEILKKIIYFISQYNNYHSICISIAGFEYQGKIQGALNMDFNNVPLKSMLKNRFLKQIYIQNDARSAALAELTYGNGKFLNNFALLTLGTGIGGAIVINKNLYLGNGAAGEVGSMFIEKNKIFEHLASGSSVFTFSREFNLQNKAIYKIGELAKKGNKNVLNLYKKIGHNLGIGLTNLSYALAPEAFIIGGGFSRVKYIFPEAIKTLKEKYTILPTPKIIKAKFGDDAGLIGAALLPRLKT